MDQFTIVNGDVLPQNDIDTISYSALLAALVEIEFRHPGTLRYLVRIAALVADGFKLKATSAHPDKSLKAQTELLEILREITLDLYEK